MHEVEICVHGQDLDQKTAQKLAELLARLDNHETICVSRYSSATNACSPCCLKSTLGDKPGWEVYGENHGGRLKISINDGEYVFIFS